MVKSLKSIVRQEPHVEGKDFLVFRTNCAASHSGSNYFRLNREVREIAWVTKRVGLQRALLLGGCIDGRYSTCRAAIKRASELGLELVWIDYQAVGPPYEDNSSIRFVSEHFGSFDMQLETWEQVKHWEKVFPLMREFCERVKVVKDRMEEEKSALSWSPVVLKVKILSKFGGEFFHSILGLPRRVESQAHLVVILHTSGKEGMLISKSQNFYFRVEETKGDISAGMELKARIGLDHGSVTIVTDPGVWKITPLDFDLANPSLHYDPIWMRLEPVEIQSK